MGQGLEAAQSQTALFPVLQAAVLASGESGPPLEAAALAAQPVVQTPFDPPGALQISPEVGDGVEALGELSWAGLGHPAHASMSWPKAMS